MFRAGYRTGQSKQSPPADIIEKARERDKGSKIKNHQYVNSKKFTKRREYVQGQLVLVQNDFKRRKFDPYYEQEPYFILSKNGELLLLLRRSDGRSVQRHTSHVKPYYVRNPPPCPDCSDNNHEQLSDIDDEPLHSSGEEQNTQPNNPELPETVTDLEGPSEPPESSSAQVVPPPSDLDMSVRRSTRPRTDTRNTRFKDFAT